MSYIISLLYIDMKPHSGPPLSNNTSGPLASEGAYCGVQARGSIRFMRHSMGKQTLRSLMLSYSKKGWQEGPRCADGCQQYYLPSHNFMYISKKGKINCRFKSNCMEDPTQVPNPWPQNIFAAFESIVMDLFMQDTPKVTSEVTPQSMYVEYYTHSFLTLQQIGNGNTLTSLE